VPIKSYKMDEGTLSLGSVGTSIDATAQVTEGAVEWSEEVEDNLPTLSGEELAGEASYAAKLTGKVIQDLSVGGLNEFTWTNKGVVVPFQFDPASAAGRTITGNVRISPLKVGGAVRSRPTADFEWACIGEPVLGASL
jgi:hypothetical protein